MEPVVVIMMVISLMLILVSLYVKLKDIEEQKKAHVKLSMLQDQKLNRVLRRISLLEDTNRKRCDFLGFEKQQVIPEASFDIGQLSPSGALTEATVVGSRDLHEISYNPNTFFLRESEKQITSTTTTTPLREVLIPEIGKTIPSFW